MSTQLKEAAATEAENHTSEPKKKPGRKPSLTPESPEFTEMKEKVEALEKQLLNLTSAFGKFAHYNGGMNTTICKEFGIEVWSPDRKAMHKHG